MPGMKPTTSFTASSSFLMALAISLRNEIRVTFGDDADAKQVNSLYCFKEGPTVGDLVGNPTQDALQRRRLLVQFLECIFSSI